MTLAPSFFLILKLRMRALLNLKRCDSAGLQLRNLWWYNKQIGQDIAEEKSREEKITYQRTSLELFYDAVYRHLSTQEELLLEYLLH